MQFKVSLCEQQLEEVELITLTTRVHSLPPLLITSPPQHPPQHLHHGVQVRSRREVEITQLDGKLQVRPSPAEFHRILNAVTVVW